AMPDGKRLVSQAISGNLKVWDVASKTVLAEHEPKTGRVDVLVVLPDGETLAYPRQGAIVLWNVKDNTERFLRGHVAEVNGLALMPDGKELISAGGEGTIKRWKLGK